MDHVKQVISKAQQVEVGPARWKVLLSIPLILGALWCGVTLMLSFPW